ncbi:hypothetical protein Trydic_g7476 [Trypoxylus dichotomus]
MGQNILFEVISVITKDPSFCGRKIREAMDIHEHRDNISRRDGYHLSAASLNSTNHSPVSPPIYMNPVLCCTRAEKENLQTKEDNLKQ